MDRTLEPRWPVMLAILVLLVLVAILPDHYRALPAWAPFVIAAAACLPMGLVMFGSDKNRWLRIESAVIKLTALLIVLTAIASLAALVSDIVRGSAQASGFVLLTSSIVVWTCNVLAFALLYWQVDGGGPTRRIEGPGGQSDWYFTQVGAPECAQPGWRPMFVDYLFLAFSTATAFSTTDTVPLTARAKLLMMLQAAVSMVTLVVVASRAINVLGSS